MQRSFGLIRTLRTVLNKSVMQSEVKSPSNKQQSNNNKQNKKPFPKHSYNKPSKNQNSLFKWPSKQHCIVNFIHSDSTFVDVDAITDGVGNVKDKYVVQLEGNLFITKLEMANSSEAEKLWTKFSSQPPVGVINVKPEFQHKTLNNKRKSKPQQRKQSERKKIFEDYISTDVVEKGIKNGDIVTGVLRVNSRKYTHSFVSDVDGRDILIESLIDRNRALEGDIVAVQINDRSKWVLGADNLFSLQQNALLNDVTESTEKLDLNEKQPSCSSENKPLFKHSRKTGKVVALLEKRNKRCTTGHIKPDDKRKDVLFSPILSSFPRMYLPKSNFKDHLTTPDLGKVLFVARMKEWSVFENIPQGELSDMIGKSGEVGPETRRILIDNHINFDEFSQEVIDSLPAVFEISDVERQKRKDLTNECIFSIDPSTAKDLDDAIHCTPLANGNYEVGVHIADVSHFVKPSTAVDVTASQRCTSVYLVQKVIPMLPHLLCEELCSLNPGSEKLAFSVIWTLTENGDVLSEWFGKSIIRSCAKLSYDHAQSFISYPERDFDDPEQSADKQEYPEIFGDFSLSDIKKKVLNLHKISQNLRKKRFNSGALQLDQVRLSYTLHPDTALPTGCYPFERKASNELIEELMLLANIAVAHKIYKAMPTHAFLRCHPSPKETMMQDFVEHCSSIGLEINSESSESLAHSIAEACGNDELTTYRKQALFVFAIKPQQLAIYLCAGMQSDEEAYHHYALNVPLYTHFTSPIRRYADIIVHRQLATVVGLEQPLPLTPEELQVQAGSCNYCKYNSRIAQDLSVELFFNLLVNNYGPFESNAMVMHVYDRSVDVLSMEYGVMKRIYIENLPGVCFKLEKKRTSEKHVVNTMKVKWLDNPPKEKDSDQPLSYDENAKGAVLIMEVFSVVKIVLEKQDRVSCRSIKASLKKPNFQPHCNGDSEQIQEEISL